MTKRRAYPKIIFPTLNEPARYVFDPAGGWRRLNPHYSWTALSVREQKDLESYLNWMGISKKSTKFPQFEKEWTFLLPYEDSSFNWNQRNWYWQAEKGDEIWEWGHILQNDSISTEEEEWDWENDAIRVTYSDIRPRDINQIIPQKAQLEYALVENFDDFKEELTKNE